MQITKRNGAKEEFSREKIENAVKKAFEAVGEDYDPNIVEGVVQTFEWNHRYNKEFSVEDIQNEIE